jgi:CRISPR-associated protein Csb1
MSMSKIDEVLSELLQPKGPEGLTLEVRLEPIEGRDAVFFPPTYAKPKDDPTRKRVPSFYNIDKLDGIKVVLIDSIPSQANRVEPIFKMVGYRDLVPQIEILTGKEVLNLLDLSHRLSDAAVRFSTEFSEVLPDVFKAAQNGDHCPLAKIGPTSLFLGMWDSGKSRTNLKIPRLLMSTIRAWGIEELTRSSQYIPAMNYRDIQDLKDVSDILMGKLGMNHVPSTNQLGGVRLTPTGKIVWSVSVNLNSLRDLRPDGQKGESLRRYILGLILVAATAPRSHNLRQGCLLVHEEGSKRQFFRRYSDGSKQPFDLGHLDHASILEWARGASDEFGVGENKTLNFDGKLGKKASVKAAKENDDPSMSDEN